MKIKIVAVGKVKEKFFFAGNRRIGKIAQKREKHHGILHETP